MKSITQPIYAGLALAFMSSTAFAGGLDRTTYSPNILFEQGNYLEGSIARVSPTLEGDLNFPGSAAPPLPPVDGVDDISPDYQLWGLAAKFDITDRLAVAFQTFDAVGADIDFSGTGNFYLPTTAELDGRAYVGTAKINLTDNFSVFGGIKYLTVRGELNALSSPTDSWEFKQAHGHGYIVGAAYSKPEIALRVSLTYETEFDIDIKTKTNSPATALYGTTTTATIPAAWELYFQTGIAPGTLLFGSVRHTAWSQANISLLNADPLEITDFSDSLTWNLGVGKAITEKMSVSLSGTYEAGDGKPSTLQPVDGKFTLALGTKFNLTENLEWSFGGSHTWVGDNETDTGAPVEGKFRDNNAWAFGTKIGFRF